MLTHSNQLNILQPALQTCPQQLTKQDPLTAYSYQSNYCPIIQKNQQIFCEQPTLAPKSDDLSHQSSIIKKNKAQQRQEQIHSSDGIQLEKIENIKEQIKQDQVELKNDRFNQKNSKNAATRVIQCQNKICNLIENIKKVKSKVTGKYFNFCQKCYESYKNNNYCYYCEQIYLSLSECDGLEWIQCQQCQRWNHTLCEKLHNGQNFKKIQQNYECPDCYRRIKRKRSQYNQSTIQYQKITKRHLLNHENGNVSDQKIKLFGSKKESLNMLDSFLANIGYKLALNDQQIKSDLTLIRGNSFRNNVQIQKIKSQNKKKCQKRKH